MAWVAGAVGINLTGLSTTTLTLPSVERHRRILLLHDSDRVAREYFLIENRFPGMPFLTNYDGPLETGAVVVWQIFEDRNIVNWSDVCQGDPRFIRRRAVLTYPQQSFELAWSDGSPAGFRISRRSRTPSRRNCASRRSSLCSRRLWTPAPRSWRRRARPLRPA